MGGEVLTMPTGKELSDKQRQVVSAVASKWWVSRCLELVALLLVIYIEGR